MSKIKYLTGVVSLFICSTTFQIDALASASPKLTLTQHADQLLRDHNYLSLRVLIRKSYAGPLTYNDWYGLLGIINTNANKIGFDLVSLWNSRNPNGKSNFDKRLEYGDSLMLAGKFEAAFSEYQNLAIHLKKQLQFFRKNKTSATEDQITQVEALYPFVLHAMGRSLYGAGRYSDALQVYSSISPSYLHFRQALFERMWTAFRSGQVEEALGAIASQRSAYFSKFLSPEAYLIETYIYKKLCRTQDVERVGHEIRLFKASLTNKQGLVEWAGNDLETRILWKLLKQEEGDSTNLGNIGITPSDLQTEKQNIRKAIIRTYESQKEKILKDLKTVSAYFQLTGVTEANTFLKPIQELTSRQQLLAQNLEIWPVDTSEEWADEIGNRFFLGASQCSKNKQ